MEFSTILEYIVKPYLSYKTSEVILEVLGALLGIVSVLLSIRKNIIVYPIGIFSTSIYIYLNYNWALYGEMLINIYYTIMSCYGWWQWHIAKENFTSDLNFKSQNLALQIIGLFIVGYLAIFLIYYIHLGSFDAIPSINFIDCLASAIFIVAMYLMAHKRIENWIFWMFGNCLAIYLFIFKGYAITALQFFVFFLLAIKGWVFWRRNKMNSISSS